MGGGLMQLVAYGAQDIYLTGNPQITFFKVVYRRHTNFSMETIAQTVNGSSSNTGSSTVTISRNGDLVHKVYVNFPCSDTEVTTGPLSSFDQVELEIGGQRIDRHSGQWLATWLDLSTPAGRAYEVSTLIGDQGVKNVNVLADTNGQVSVAQIPLQFWFCRNPGLALPLIALQYHEVKLKFEWKAPATTNQLDFEVLCDYIYLDTDERRRFAQVSHEYLIEQVQEQTESVTGNATSQQNFRLNFNHPVKELIWSFGTAASAAGNSLMGTSTPPAGKSKARLQLNGHDRFADMPMEYFGLRQCIDYHSAVPGPNLAQTAEGVYGSGNTSGSICTQLASQVYVYSFALKPEEHQPSGTCNFSRIDNAKLICDAASGSGGSDTAATQCKIFAVNYNVLRIMSGMGGLAYSN
jgi:hypothetical protein